MKTNFEVLNKYTNEEIRDWIIEWEDTADSYEAMSQLGGDSFNYAILAKKYLAKIEIAQALLDFRSTEVSDTLMRYAELYPQSFEIEFLLGTEEQREAFNAEAIDNLENNL